MSLSQVNKDILYLKQRSHHFGGTEKRKREQEASGAAGAAGSEPEECGICMEPLNEPVTQLNCRHKFHKDCICQWFRGSERRKFTCPMCRAPSTISEINRLCGVYMPPQRELPPSRRNFIFDDDIMDNPALRRAMGIPDPVLIQDDGDW